MYQKIIRWRSLFRPFDIRYGFNSQRLKDTETADSKQQKSKQEKQRQRLSREMAMRRAREQKQKQQIKKSQDDINTTSGYFNPMAQYLELYQWRIMLIALFGYGLYVIATSYLILELFEDPLDGSKKLVLVSRQCQRKRNTLLNTLFRIYFQPSGGISKDNLYQQKTIDLEKYLQQVTGRAYTIKIVAHNQHSIIVLPQTIYVTRNLLLHKDFALEQLKKTLLLMQCLFARRFHIKELKIKGQMYYKPLLLQYSRIQSILLSIYLRSYSRQQVQSTITLISSKYQIDSRTIQSCLRKLLRFAGKDRSQISLNSRVNLHELLSKNPSNQDLH